MQNKNFFNIILLIITIIGVGGSFGYIFYIKNKKMATLDVFNIIWIIVVLLVLIILLMIYYYYIKKIIDKILDCVQYLIQKISSLLIRLLNKKTSRLLNKAEKVEKSDLRWFFEVIWLPEILLFGFFIYLTLKF